VIRVGAIADLLLVRGDPTTDVKATRAIENVWRAGQ
jgi:imidazolonepropionase-like amidohydrolase